MRKLFCVLFLCLLLALPAMAQKGKHIDIVLNTFGTPVGGVTITVFLADTVTPATLYTDKNGLITTINPFQADVFGNYSFYADPGIYDVQISGTGITTFTNTDIFVPQTSGPGSGLGTVGSVVFINAAGDLDENPTKLFWDNTLFRFGVGTATPSVDFNLEGTAALFDNPDDGDFNLDIDSGSSAEQDSCIDLSDQGTVAYSICKSSIGDFTISQTGATFTSIELKATGNVTIRTSASAKNIFFRDSANNIMGQIADNGTVGDMTVTGTLTVDGVMQSAVDDEVLVSNGTTMENKAVPDCDVAVIDSLQYDTTGNVFSCDTQPVTDNTLLVGNNTTREAKALPDCDTPVIDSLQYDDATNVFSCDVQAVTDDSLLVGNATTRETKVVPDCDVNVGDALQYDQGANVFTCVIHGTPSYTLQVGSTVLAAPADTTIYFFGGIRTTPNTTATEHRIPVPITGTVVRFDLFIQISGTDGSSENSTFDLRLNNTTDFCQITENHDGDVLTSTTCSQAVSAGDYLEIKWATPNWVTTNPTSVLYSIVITIEQ